MKKSLLSTYYLVLMICWTSAVFKCVDWHDLALACSHKSVTNSLTFFLSSASFIVSWSCDTDLQVSRCSWSPDICRCRHKGQDFRRQSRSVHTLSSHHTWRIHIHKKAVLDVGYCLTVLLFPKHIYTYFFTFFAHVAAVIERWTAKARLAHRE